MKGIDLSRVTIDILLTGRCNEACPFCYGARKPNKFVGKTKVPVYGKNDLPEITTGEALDIVNIFYNLGVRSFNIGGGEPTLRPDLYKVLGHIKSFSDPTTAYISTNALVLSRSGELRRQIYSTTDIVGLSLDGSDERMNREMGRSIGHFEANRQFLEQISTEAPVLPIKIGTVVSAVNYSDLLKVGNVIERWRNEYDLNLLTWRLFQFSPIEEGNENREIYQLEEEEFFEVTRPLIERFPSMKISIRPHSMAEGAYFLVLPTGELAVVSNGEHKRITGKLLDMSESQIFDIMSAREDTVNKVEENREWLLK